MSLLLSSLKLGGEKLKKSFSFNQDQNINITPFEATVASKSADSIFELDDALASTALNLKLESKVKSLEKVLSRMGADHANTLVGLHSEIERLSSLVSEMMLVMATEGSVDGIKKISRSDSVHKFLSDPTGLRSDSLTDMYRALEMVQKPLTQLSPPPPPPTKNMVDEECQTEGEFGAKLKAKTKPKRVDHATETIAVLLASHETQTITEVLSGKPVVLEEKAHHEEDLKIVEESRPKMASDESIYLLVQKEKKKFNVFVERAAEEKKRRQLEIESLKAEMKTLKSVLKLAGLSYNINDFKDILQAHQDVDRLMTPITVIRNKDLVGAPKQAILPPINGGASVESKVEHPFDDDFDQDIHNTIHELQQSHHNSILHHTLLSNEKHLMLGSIQDDSRSDLFSEAAHTIVAPPSQLAPPPTTTRKNRFKRTANQHVPVVDEAHQEVTAIPAILAHNQNLDYQGRAHIYLDNVVLETNSGEDAAMFKTMATTSLETNPAASEQRSPLLTRVFAKTLAGKKEEPSNASTTSSSERILPPLRDAAATEDASKKTSFSRRLWRSKVVRSKVLKSLENKF